MRRLLAVLFPAAVLFVAAGLALPKDSLAQALQVDILESTYTTSLHKELFAIPPDPPIDTTIIQTAPHPIANSIRGSYTDGSITHFGEASSSAGTFDVMASANTGLIRDDGTTGRDNWWSTSATAASDVTFSPLRDATANLLIGYSSFLDSFTKGSISLFDNTLGQELFSHTFAGHGFQDLAFNSLFDDDHIYRLSLFAWSSANGDSELVKVALSGFQVVPAVPEPAAYAMMLIGLAGVALALRRRPRSPGSGV